MHFFTILAVISGFVASTLSRGWGGPGEPKRCLNQTDVSYLIRGYQYLLEKPGGPSFNVTAQTLLSKKFMVMSDSINILSGQRIGDPAYGGRASLINSQFQTPPLPTVATLGIFYTCDQISWRWNASVTGNDTVAVKGILNMNVNVAALQIDTVYSEFNTAAFQVNLGNPECQKK